MSNIRTYLEGAQAALKSADEMVAAAMAELTGDEPEWVYPVGSLDYPTEQWYCAAVHDPTGKLNAGYGHTGIDLNVDHRPWGDVDRGQPVWAVTAGVIHAAHYSTSYLGSVVVKIQHGGAPLYVRYWHLENDATFQQWEPGAPVKTDERIGHLGNYRLGAGGDHCHFDMALDPFGPHWWYTRHSDVRWIDPVPVLKAHLDPGVVDAMMEKDE